MLRHSRNLLLIAALCWVAPLSAQQPSAATMAGWHSPDCPYARAHAKAEPTGGDAARGMPLFGRDFFLP